MAGSKNTAEKGKGKGVAFAKWAKIDKAQRNMFLAVCGTSIVLGVTLVSGLYFTKVISFNGKLIDEKDKIIKDYSSIQKSLSSISKQVDELRNNESLEAVSRTRAADCAKYSSLLNKSDEDSDSEVASIDEDIEIELARICTALRLIPDAIPSKNNTEATLASLNQLLLWSDSSIQIEGLSASDSRSSVAFTDQDGRTVTTTLQPIGAALSLDDTAEKIHRALDTIENSIRNYDISSASITFSGDSTSAEEIELRATFRAYYSNPVSIQKQTKKICADEKSEKCTGKKSSGKK